MICVLVWVVNIPHFNDPLHGSWFAGGYESGGAGADRVGSFGRGGVVSLVAIVAQCACAWVGEEARDRTEAVLQMLRSPVPTRLPRVLLSRTVLRQHPLAGLAATLDPSLLSSF